MRLGGFGVISLAQVLAAMAVGALPPVTILLMREIRRLRRSVGGATLEMPPPEPDRVVDDDALSRQVEAVAQIAAANFELLDRVADSDNADLHESLDEPGAVRSKRHLTLVLTGRTRRLNGSQVEKKRSCGHGECPPRIARHTSGPRRSSASLTRD